MFTNIAYLGTPSEDIVDNESSLRVTAVGNFRLDTGDPFETVRPHGRGDYQLYYIASGKAHFFFNGNISSPKNQSEFFIFTNSPSGTSALTSFAAINGFISKVERSAASRPSTR